MAQIPLNKIFLGHTPIEQRKYILTAFRHLKNKYPTLILPAVGQFTLAKCAIEAGYERQNIFTSDISLFTSALGFLFSGKPVDALNFEFDGDASAEYRRLYDEKKTEEERIGFLMWLMKLAQISKVHYQRLMFEDLVENHRKHEEEIVGQVVAMRDYFKGINYEIKDLRDELVERGSETLMVINPPVFKKGYTKMFDFRGFLKYENGVEEFDWAKEYKALYEKSKTLNYPVIWYRFRDVKGFNEDEIMFAKEYEVEKQDYWLITKPNAMADFPYYKQIASFKRKNLRPSQYPLFGEEDVINENSTVRFVSAPEEVVLYYRDLFAHRLGNTGAEHYYLMLIDGKVFSVVGFMTSKLFRLQQDKIFENFGFSVSSKRYPHANRLLMLMITSKEMGAVLRRTTSKVNRYYKLTGMKTTCLSKYRSIKTHQGILERISREQLPNGLYKIQAQCDWANRDFKETLKIFLKENELGHKILTNQK